MKIAFYAPLKPPDHPVPSGDRLMARQLMAALAGAGHSVTLASGLRARMADPADTAHAVTVADAAAGEVARLTEAWRQDGSPDLWFTYHPYYKAPDLIGPPLCTRFGLPYVTAESSFSARRTQGVWADSQRHVLAGLGRAAVNICLTARDERGILSALAGARTARLLPFVDIQPFAPAPAPREHTPREHAGPLRLATVAMMREGDKHDSYAMLARALTLIGSQADWTLSIAGTGPREAEVRSLFAPFGARVTFHGLLPPEAVRDLLAQSDIFVWPGFGEAYGLAYLEAQASGLPVVAQGTAGVPEVVAQGETGLLCAERDDEGFAQAILRLTGDAQLRQAMGRAARARVAERHSATAAAARLDEILRTATGRP
jgi:glycosyltransferase involved in cell wall biosynthesis